MTHENIPVLTPLWWAGLLASVLVVLGTCIVFRVTPVAKRRRLGAILGVFLLVETVALHLYLALVAELWTLADSLPLHICRLSIVIGGTALITRSQLLYEVSGYLGVPAGIHAIITPELTQGLTRYLVFDYYLSHSLLIAVPIAMSAFLGMRPRQKAAVYTFLFTNVAAAIVYPIDVALGANYMYLAERPSANNPFLIGRWPWYILGAQVAFLLHLAVMDVLIRIRPYHALFARRE